LPGFVYESERCSQGIDHLSGTFIKTGQRSRFSMGSGEQPDAREADRKARDASWGRLREITAKFK
jgi:hypothetical protein